MITFLKNGTVSEEEKPALPRRMTAQAATPATTTSASEPQLAGDAGGLAAGDLEIVVVEADGAVAERHEQHDPDVPVGPGWPTAASTP